MTEILARKEINEKAILIPGCEESSSWSHSSDLIPIFLE
jgi:hypothetical protein